MPIWDLLCQKGHVTEHYLHRHDSPNPPCDRCGGETNRLPASRFGITFTGEITKKYLDSSKEGYDQASSGAHWVYEKKGPDGEPLAVPRRRLISTFQEQADYCKQEGLHNPKDCGPGEMNSDGTAMRGYGMPGCEV